jgi:hypothetical protein
MYFAASKPSIPSLGLSLNVGPKTISSVLFESSQYHINSLFNKKFSSKATIQLARFHKAPTTISCTSYKNNASSGQPYHCSCLDPIEWKVTITC